MPFIPYRRAPLVPPFGRALLRPMPPIRPMVRPLPVRPTPVVRHVLIAVPKLRK